MLLLVHPTGNECVRQALRAFSDASMLAEFHTGLNWNPEGLLDRMAPPELRAQLRRRSFPRGVRRFVRAHPALEAGRLLCQSLRWRLPIAHERGWFSVDSVYRDIDRRAARRLRAEGRISVVYAYEDGAFDCFAAAAGVGAARIYDLPIGYWRAARQLFEEEAEREPEWACTLTGSLDSAEKLRRKELELQRADAIVVASSFTKATVSQAPALSAPVYVVPCGAPPVASSDRPATDARKPLRVMYAGTLTQRKGLSYFLAACDLVKEAVTVTILGRRQGEGCVPLERALRRFRYIETLPHQELLAEMGRQDVLVFPSLFEGFGLVILEAMAQGVPVITTASTAGPDLITEGEDGFIVPTRDPRAIAQRLELLAGDRERLRAMSAAARAKAATLGWDAYRRKLVEAVRAATSLPRPAASRVRESA